ncbi:MAG: hypothetical protein Q8R76_07535 [Candidatus Omnitrophota bacterium]|nr:hypothetical protein [Candidatus Omnitrophota bacterium]
MSSRHIFRPRLRLLIDILLYMNVAVLFVLGLRLLPIRIGVAVQVVLNILVIAAWFTVISYYFSVEFSQSKIYGPDWGPRRASLSLTQVNHDRFEHRTWFSRWVCRRVWALDGKTKVCLWRPFLGKNQMRAILDVIYQFPLREAAGRKGTP